MKNFKITLHALERIFERYITPDECMSVLQSGIIIEDYPDDNPFPSKLMKGEIQGRVIHIVVSENFNDIYLITAYEPDHEQWDQSFTKRRKSL